MPPKATIPPDKKHDAKVDAAKARAVADGWKGFVNCELNEQQKVACKALRDNSAAVWTTVEDLVGGQYKASMSYSPEQDVYNFSMTCKAAKDVNNGLTLTGRGGTLVGAMASFVYKHSIVLESDWTTAALARSGQADEDFVG